MAAESRPEVELGAEGIPGVSLAPEEQNVAPVFENHHQSDDKDDAEVMFNGDNLLANLDDHFSLPKASCYVRSRNKADGVRV